MILTKSEIKKQVGLNRICINPFDENQLNPNSYNYRIDETLIEITDNPIDPKSKINHREIKLTEEGYELKPNHLYLGNTFEIIGSNHYVLSLIGRSSMARLGLFLQITSDLGHLGAIHRWTIELTTVQPVIIYPFMEIGQVSFWSVQGDSTNLYCGKYAKYSTAHCSDIHLEFPESFQGC